MYTVELRFYEELNDFLPPRFRKRPFRVRFPERRSVKDLIEAQGVPHTEVDLILVNGESVGFDYIVRDGDRISVYPTFESLDISPVSRLDRPPLRRPRFVADVHLRKLARRLRLLGFDCLWNPKWTDAQLAAISAREQRVLLTRDRALLMRAIVTHGIYLHSDDSEQQVRQVLERLDLYGAATPFARCIECNGVLRPIEKQAAKDRIPPRTYRYIDEYYECTACGKVYWKGTHWPRLQRLIEQALAPEPHIDGAPDADAESDSR